MKTLSLLSQKGGVGKTTLATCLAVAAEQDGKTVAIIDLDPQATASFWKDVRGAETPAVISIQPVRLKSVIAAAKDAGTDLVIIDGAAVQREVAYEAAAVSDFVLIPTKPAVFDTMSMTQTQSVVRQHDCPSAIVLNMVAPSGQELSDGVEAAKSLGTDCAPVLIRQRKAFFRAQGQGLAVQEYEPGGKAAAEIAELYAYTCIQLYGKEERDEQIISKRIAGRS
ncbi:MAG: ParA family protein [Pseudomonadota bacterium]